MWILFQQFCFQWSQSLLQGPVLKENYTSLGSLVSSIQFSYLIYFSGKIQKNAYCCTIRVLFLSVCWPHSANNMFYFADFKEASKVLDLDNWSPPFCFLLKKYIKSSPNPPTNTENYPLGLLKGPIGASLRFMQRRSSENHPCPEDDSPGSEDDHHEKPNHQKLQFRPPSVDSPGISYAGRGTQRLVTKFETLGRAGPAPRATPALAA